MVQKFMGKLFFSYVLLQGEECQLDILLIWIANFLRSFPRFASGSVDEF